MTKLDKFLIGMDAGTREFWRRINEYIAEKAQELANHEPYQKVNREGEEKNKVVKVSDVMQALHYMSAHMAFRVIPQLAMDKVEELGVKAASRWITARVAKFAAGSIPTPATLVEAAKVLVSTNVRATVEEKIETDIRNYLGTPRYQMPWMFQGRGVRFGTRPVRDISSRHKTTPKKRMKKWASR